MGRIRNSRQVRKILGIALLTAILVFAKTNYFLMLPGSAEELSGLVSVESKPGEDQGSFFLVTVLQQRATPVLVFYGLLNPNADLRQRWQVISPNMDPEEYDKLMERWMQESQDLAKVIALRRFGYYVPIESDGVEVVEIGVESPARGILQPGDVILAVDGKQVFLAEELVSRVQLRSVGDPVTLTIKREGKEQKVTLPTTSHVETPEKAAIRVMVQTLNWQPQLPVDIKIETGEISGPSAGMMFVLEILNQLDPRDLTGGRKIAGTGTINLKEEIGPIGGVRQKVVAAERAGAEYFLVPQENYEEAKPVADKINLVPVGTLSQAIEFLEGLGS